MPAGNGNGWGGFIQNLMAAKQAPQMGMPAEPKMMPEPSNAPFDQAPGLAGAKANMQNPAFGNLVKGAGMIGQAMGGQKMKLPNNYKAPAPETPTQEY